jgi:hypothetical protein
MQTLPRSPTTGRSILSCPPTSIPVRNAAKISKHFSQCATSRIVSAQRNFAGCRSGDMETSSGCLAPGRASSSRDPVSTSQTTEAIRTKKQPKKNLPPPRLLKENQTLPKKPARLHRLLPVRRLRKNRKRNPIADDSVGAMFLSSQALIFAKIGRPAARPCTLRNPPVNQPKDRQSVTSQISLYIHGRARRRELLAGSQAP